MFFMRKIFESSSGKYFSLQNNNIWLVNYWDRERRVITLLKLSGPADQITINNKYIGAFFSASRYVRLSWSYLW